MITLFIETEPGLVQIRQRAESPGGFVGDATVQVRPGEDYHGYSFADLAALGDGSHTLPLPKPEVA